MKNHILYCFFCVIICAVFSCKKDKVPDSVSGQITLYTKNGINRMDTIQKYIPNREIKLEFGQSYTELSGKITYPFICHTSYIINGVSYETPNYASNCLGPTTSYTSLIFEGLLWKAYSHDLDKFVPLVDDVQACTSALWKFDRIGKKGDFNLEHTTDGGDVYKLEFR